MEDIQQRTSKSDELDLMNLIETSISFIRNFGRVLVICTILGLVASIALYMLTPKKYASRLLLHSGILTNQEEIEVIGSWKELLRKGETQTLASNLNCNIGVIKKLSDISAEEVQKLYVQNNPNGFIVEVLVTDTSILDELQSGIVYGLENSGYVRERVLSKRASFQDLIQKVQSEIARLDQTKASVERMLSNPNSNGSSMLIDVSGINTQWVALNEKLHSYQEELKFVNAVQVLQNFNKMRKPEEPKLVKSVVFGLVAGAFIGFIVALLLYVRQKLKNRPAVRI